MAKLLRLPIPKRGEKLEMIMMAQKNAQDALEKRNAKQTILYERTKGACAGLANAIGMAQTPRRIEGYDISNTQGVFSVGAMVGVIDGEAAKKEYRHFRIKTVEGPNDYASHYEMMDRRMEHGLKEREERQALGLEMIGGKFSDLPDLILIDGGPGQLKYAREAMQKHGLNIPMFGLAERLEDIYLPGIDQPIKLDHHTPSFTLFSASVMRRTALGLRTTAVCVQRRVCIASWRILKALAKSAGKHLLSISIP